MLANTCLPERGVTPLAESSSYLLDEHAAYPIAWGYGKV